MNGPVNLKISNCKTMCSSDNQKVLFAYKKDEFFSSLWMIHVRKDKQCIFKSPYNLYTVYIIIIYFTVERETIMSQYEIQDSFDKLKH